MRSPCSWGPTRRAKASFLPSFPVERIKWVVVPDGRATPAPPAAPPDALFVLGIEDARLLDTVRLERSLTLRRWMLHVLAGPAGAELGAVSAVVRLAAVRGMGGEEARVHTCGAGAAEAWRVGALADRVGCTVRHLQLVARRRGVVLRDVLARMRLIEALEHRCRGRRTVHELARCVGLSCGPSFSRFCRRVAGVTPSSLEPDDLFVQWAALFAHLGRSSA
ncbi:MAG: helix-turn-helix domain-containing protein [Gemmatimonadetes bacterium]|nr:MAG: helix-turn-helix domain-containing protein [Gemmatimonadota bacterium]